MLPDKVRHEEVTFQVPTTSPPQEDPSVQLDVVPPEAVEPPLPAPPAAVEPPLPAPPLAVEPPLPTPPLPAPPLALPPLPPVALAPPVALPPLPPPAPPLPESWFPEPQALVTIIEPRASAPSSPMCLFCMGVVEYCSSGGRFVTDFRLFGRWNRGRIRCAAVSIPSFVSAVGYSSSVIESSLPRRKEQSVTDSHPRRVVKQEERTTLYVKLEELRFAEGVQVDRLPER
jgi:hypothetical protein